MVRGGGGGALKFLQIVIAREIFVTERYDFRYISPPNLVTRVIMSEFDILTYFFTMQ